MESKMTSRSDHKCKLPIMFGKPVGYVYTCPSHGRDNQGRWTCRNKWQIQEIALGKKIWSKISD